METTQPLSDVEALYQRILDLTLLQEECLSRGDVDALPGLVAEKIEILSRTEALMSLAATRSDRMEQSFQEGLQRLAEILGQVVASEERCKMAAPAHPPSSQAPPARAIAAYGRR